ncbi:hypothetical protein AAFF_G00320010 [Aldrovandia affinis]|uniref:Uncharacterized protein n=1 Tax=Aldrovandia affinis TaxID=143900 RepID=A0AAD7SNR2_9TELE|nr:hypothetical protein AAFF_G00320010 [Aldrovandia affinis]
MRRSCQPGAVRSTSERAPLHRGDTTGTARALIAAERGTKLFCFRRLAPTSSEIFRATVRSPVLGSTRAVQAESQSDSAQGTGQNVLPEARGGAFPNSCYIMGSSLTSSAPGRAQQPPGL